MTVEFVQIVGKRGKRHGGTETIAQPVDQVVIDGQMIGTIGRHNEAGLCVILDASPEQRAEWHAAVKKERADKKLWSVSDKISFPPSTRDINEAVRILSGSDEDGTDVDEEPDVSEDDV